MHLVGPVLILPLLTDVFLTLIRRARNGDNLLQAHNTHVYQRLIKHGFSHMTVSWYYALLALICANFVVVGLPRGWLDGMQFPLILVGVAIAAYWLTSQALANAGNNKSG